MVELKLENRIILSSQDFDYDHDLYRSAEEAAQEDFHRRNYEEQTEEVRASELFAGMKIAFEGVISSVKESKFADDLIITLESGRMFACDSSDLFCVML